MGRKRKQPLPDEHFWAENAFWTEERQQFLVDNYGSMTFRELLETLDIRITPLSLAVRQLEREGRIEGKSKAAARERRSSTSRWSEAEEDYVTKNYDGTNLGEVASGLLKNFGTRRTLYAVVTRVSILGLGYRHAINPYRQIEESRQFLIENYDNMLLDDLAAVLGISRPKLDEEAKRLMATGELKSVRYLTEGVSIWKIRRTTSTKRCLVMRRPRGTPAAW